MKENGTPTMVKNVSEIKPRFRFEVPGLVGHDPNREGWGSRVGSRPPRSKIGRRVWLKIGVTDRVSPNLCPRAGVHNSTRSRPCRPQDDEAYLSSVNWLALEQQLTHGTVLHRWSFALRYEFVAVDRFDRPPPASQPPPIGDDGDLNGDLNGDDDLDLVRRFDADLFLRVAHELAGR